MHRSGSQVWFLKARHWSLRDGCRFNVFCELLGFLILNLWDAYKSHLFVNKKVATRSVHLPSKGWHYKMRLILTIGFLSALVVHATELLDRNLAYRSPFLGIKEVGMSRSRSRTTMFLFILLCFLLVCSWHWGNPSPSYPPREKANGRFDWVFRWTLSYILWRKLRQCRCSLPILWGVLTSSSEPLYLGWWRKLYSFRFVKSHRNYINEVPLTVFM